MKSIEDFYKEIVESKELQDELKAASDEMLKTFLKEHDCDTSVKEFTEYAKSQEEGELEDNDAEAIVGGTYIRPLPALTPKPVL